MGYIIPIDVSIFNCEVIVHRSPNIDAHIYYTYVRTSIYAYTYIYIYVDILSPEHQIHDVTERTLFDLVGWVLPRSELDRGPVAVGKFGDGGAEDDTTRSDPTLPSTLSHTLHSRWK